MANIEEIEGIGTACRQKLAQAGITTSEALSESAGISEILVLRWVNHADLFRIPGIRPQYAELLGAAGGRFGAGAGAAHCGQPAPEVGGDSPA